MPNYIYSSTSSTTNNNTMTSSTTASNLGVQLNIVGGYNDVSRTYTYMPSDGYSMPKVGQYIRINDGTGFVTSTGYTASTGLYGVPGTTINIKYNDYTGDIISNDMDWLDYKRPIRIGDMVNTPFGPGLVHIIEDDLYCVEIDPTSNILHEFEINEIERHV